MPSKIKLGKTEVCPHRRLLSLQSTGVPTPFILEFSAEVDDCHASEKAAHKVLERFRVSGNREFFEISVADALRSILPVIGDYEIHSYRRGSTTEACLKIDAGRKKRRIEEEQQRKLQAQIAEERAVKAQQEQREADRKRAIEHAAQAKIIRGNIARLETKLADLGPWPVRKKLDPMRWGVVTWLIGALLGAGYAVAVAPHDGLGGGYILFFGSWVVGAILYRKKDRANWAEYERLTAPMRPITNEMIQQKNRLAMVDPSVKPPGPPKFFYKNR